jgi:hypothetical protein
VPFITVGAVEGKGEVKSACDRLHGLSHRISRRSKTRYRFAIKNNLFPQQQHPLTEKSLMIFRFRAAVEATNRIMLSLRQKYNKSSGVILLIPEVLA